MKKTIRVVATLAVFVASLQAQNINNTLGAGGTFAIKNGATTYLTLAQSNGLVTLNNSLSLPVTSGANVGVIYKGVNRFLHDYGPNSTFLGVNAGTLSVSGIGNTGVGYASLGSLTSGNDNSALGYQALGLNANGFSNSAFGYQALSSNSSGSSNTAAGMSSLLSNTTGTNNSAFGANALQHGTTASNNSAFGVSALQSDTTGAGNTAVGSGTMFAVTIGSNNTAIGYQAGSSTTTGANNTFLGYQALAGSPTDSNEICLGNSSIKQIRCAVSSISMVSDARDKKNIRDLPTGLDFLMTIKPRLFNWDRREWYGNEKSDGSKMEKTPTAGFIAQEFDAAESKANADWLRLVVKSNPDKMEITPGNLLPVVVKAIQELKAENDALRERLARLERTENEKMAIGQKVSQQ